MRIEIDQSGKVENTNKPTVIAFSGKKEKFVIIFAGEKQNRVFSGNLSAIRGLAGRKPTRLIDLIIA